MTGEGMFPDAPVPIAAQIACVERELKMRASVYPRRVGEGKMSQALADREVAAMRAVLETLNAVESLEKKYDDFRQRYREVTGR